jgi:hypothetical protein
MSTAAAASPTVKAIRAKRDGRPLIYELMLQYDVSRVKVALAMLAFLARTPESAHVCGVQWPETIYDARELDDSLS